MTIQELYAAVHGNYDEAKTRLMSDRLIEKFALKFPADPTMKALMTAVDANDIPAAFAAAHTLKGVSANLAFTELATCASDLTEQLRPRTEPADDLLYEKVLEAYTMTVAGINEYIQQKS